MKWLAELPATNVRILITMLIFIATGVASEFGQKAVETEWLITLAVMAGVDLAQHINKRWTFEPSPPATPDVEDAAAEPKPAEPRNLIREPKGDAVTITYPSAPVLRDTQRKEAKLTPHPETESVGQPDA
jgi:hypothetical protein